MLNKRTTTAERITTGLPAGIVERYHAKPEDGTVEQIIDAFAPSASPHTEYPAGVPFLPDTLSYVTTHPGGEAPPGVRWQTADADAAAQHIIAVSRANGWSYATPDDKVVVAINKMMPVQPGVKTTYLRNGNLLRTIIVVDIAGTKMVQLLDAKDPF